MRTRAAVAHALLEIRGEAPARIVDPSSIAKLRLGVLKGIQIRKRFVSLVDRLAADAEVSWAKATFWREFSTQMRKAMASTGYEFEDDFSPETTMNAVNPATLTEDETDISPDASFNALRDGKPGPALFRDMRDVFRRGPGFQNLIYLRDRVPPPAEIWATMITQGGNPARDAMLVPLVKSAAESMVESNSAAHRSDGERMTKAQRTAQSALASAYTGSTARMLQSNSR